MSRSVRVVVLAITSALVVAGCGLDDDVSNRQDAPRDRPSRGAQQAPAIAVVGRFDSPVHAVAVPGSDLVAVVEKGGRVVVASGMSCQAAGQCPARPVTTGTVVLDITDSVSRGSEQGLLGFAFHPDWPADPRVFIDYTDAAGDTRIEAWTLASPASTARRERELLRIEQPYENHNGGHLAFGPDGLLYIGTGDGGAGGDPEDRAQEGDELLGKLLRIDVDAGGERGYGIPAGNLRDGAREVWAVGLRNPWRFSFDSETGDLWIGDVGQNAWEELDVLPESRLGSGSTPNFGWRRLEGYEPYDESGRRGPGDVVAPVLAYGRDEGCSITGGVVYRGRLVPDIEGWYLFADFCGDDLRLLDAADVPGGSFASGELTWTSIDGPERVASIAEVQHGEVLVVSLDGPIGQVVPS